MQKFGKTLITDSGRRMLVQVDGAQGQITYTNAALFTQDIKDMSEEDQIALTALTGQQLITPVSVSQVTDTTVTVSASFNNSKVTEDLKFNSIGWYAKTSVDKKEQLMAITPSLTEQTLVAGAEGASTSSLDIDMVFGRSHDTTVVLNPNQEGVVNSGQMQEAIDKAINDNAAQLKAELAKSYAAKDEVYPKQDVFSKEEIKSLAPLNAPDGNNVYDTTINLDTYSAVGTTKFLNCKLQSSGQMAGFKQETEKLYGWILNIPKWNGATEFQQIVYICDYGQGTLKYVRSRVNNEGKNKENFEKILTDKDLQKAINSFGQTKSVNNHKPDSAGNIDLSDIFDQKVDKSSVYTKDETYTKAEINEKVGDQVNSVTVNGQKAGSNGDIDLSGIFARKTDLGSLYGMTANGAKQTFSGATVNPDTITDTGVYKISACTVNTKVNDAALNGTQWGWLIVLNYDESATTNALYQFLILNEKIYRRVASLQYQTFPSFKTMILPSLNNPDYTITASTFDVDTVSDNGIYRFDGTNLTASKRVGALASLPTTTISGAKGYLIQVKYTDYYTMQLLILYDVPNNTDITLAFRCVGLDSSGYRDTFKRILTDIDFNTLDNKITGLTNKVDSQVYNAPDYETGLAYSKAHPNAWVTTP